MKQLITLPCGDCGKRAKAIAEMTHSVIPQDTRYAEAAQVFSTDVMLKVNFIASGIASGKLDSVIAVLALRRDLAFLAFSLETCEICRKDIQMSAELDQRMIDAKATRLMYQSHQRWRALKMYCQFQKSVFRGVLKWVFGL